MANSFLWFVPTGNPAIPLTMKDPWLSVPGLPLVWRIGGDPAILPTREGPVAFRPRVTPGLAIILISVNMMLTGDPAVLYGKDPWLSVPGLPLVWLCLRRPGCPFMERTRGFPSQGYPWFGRMHFVSLLPMFFLYLGLKKEHGHRIFKEPLRCFL